MAGETAAWCLQVTDLVAPVGRLLDGAGVVGGVAGDVGAVQRMGSGGAQCGDPDGEACDGCGRRCEEPGDTGCAGDERIRTGASQSDTGGQRTEASQRRTCLQPTKTRAGGTCGGLGNTQPDQCGAGRDHPGLEQLDRLVRRIGVDGQSQ